MPPVGTPRLVPAGERSLVRVGRERLQLCEINLEVAGKLLEKETLNGLANSTRTPLRGEPEQFVERLQSRRIVHEARDVA